MKCLAPVNFAMLIASWAAADRCGRQTVWRNDNRQGQLLLYHCLTRSRLSTAKWHIYKSHGSPCCVYGSDSHCCNTRKSALLCHAVLQHLLLSGLRG
ncbi:hypothetical protein LY78DRAFT_138189 [Colletotrichum sublineola]|nr:hypothetical protein LY78DRAFT_138189 [Colletotrichum sublineola]